MMGTKLVVRITDEATGEYVEFGQNHWPDTISVTFEHAGILGSGNMKPADVIRAIYGMWSGQPFYAEHD